MLQYIHMTQLIFLYKITWRD